MMSVKISSTWAHDSAHFSFYRQSPHDQARLPFVTEQTETRADRVLCVLSIVLLAVGGFLVLGLS